MALSSRGEFWQEYWSYHRRRYPEDVRDGWADSNVRHATVDNSLSLSLYLMQDPSEQAGIFMVSTHLEAPERADMVEPYLQPLREVLNDATQSDMGGTHLSVDVRDPANWDAMREWLHHRKLIYQLVIREVVRQG